MHAVAAVRTSQVLELLTVIISQDRSWVWTAIEQNVVAWCKITYIQQKELYGNLCFIKKNQGNYGDGRAVILPGCDQCFLEEGTGQRLC